MLEDIIKFIIATATFSVIFAMWYITLIAIFA